MEGTGPGWQPRSSPAYKSCSSHASGKFPPGTQRAATFRLILNLSASVMCIHMGNVGARGQEVRSALQLLAHTALFCLRHPCAALSQPGSHMNPSFPDSWMFFLTSPVSLATSLLCDSLAGQSTSTGVARLEVPVLGPHHLLVRLLGFLTRIGIMPVLRVAVRTK